MLKGFSRRWSWTKYVPTPDARLFWTSYAAPRSVHKVVAPDIWRGTHEAWYPIRSREPVLISSDFRRFPDAGG